MIRSVRHDAIGATADSLRKRTPAWLAQPGAEEQAARSANGGGAGAEPTPPRACDS
jgi:hypothetical protein